MATVRVPGVTSLYSPSAAELELDELDCEDPPPHALNGQPIGAQSGSSGEDWAKENLKDSAYTPFQETPDMLAALRTGKIKAVIYDEPAAAYNIAHEYDDCTILEVIPTGEQYGIIVNTDNVALAEAINNALAEMQADGTIAKLQEEWFGAAK